MQISAGWMFRHLTFNLCFWAELLLERCLCSGAGLGPLNLWTAGSPMLG